MPYPEMQGVEASITVGMDFLGILETSDGSIWFGALGPESGVYRYDGKTVTDFKSAVGQR